MTTLPSTTWRMLAQRSVGDQKLPEGIDAAWDSAAGLVRRLLTARAAYLKRAEKIIAIRDGLADLPDGALRKEALRLKETFRLGKDTRADLEQAQLDLLQERYNIVMTLVELDALAGGAILSEYGE